MTFTAQQIRARFLNELADKAERTGQWTPDMRHSDKAEHGHDLKVYIQSLRTRAASLGN